MKIVIKNELEMIEQGRKFANSLTGGMILCLHGELGSGKTTFVKGIAKHFDIKNDIKSPTFSIMNTYNLTTKDNLVLIHIDTYRLKNEHELVEIGVEDYLGKPNTISLIEWPEKMTSLLNKKNVADIYFNHTPEGFREIII